MRSALAPFTVSRRPVQATLSLLLSYSLCACIGSVNSASEGSGGMKNLGGQAATGGAPSSGGMTQTGGMDATGGAGSGGMTQTGGMGATGGAGSGGMTQTGGVDATGGAGSGGMTLTGGVDATGGAGSGGWIETGGTGPGPNQVGVWVAQGHMGRLMMSCDNGDSWPVDVSRASGTPCNGMDCDHHKDGAMGLAFGNGGFVATFGWKDPGGMVQSANGVDWAPVTTDTIFANVAFGNDIWMAGSNQPSTSSDGLSWTPRAAGVIEFFTPRTVLFAPIRGGTFIVAGSRAASDPYPVAVYWTTDDGVTFEKPTVEASDCGTSPAYGNGIVLLMGRAGGCVSNDGGVTWANTTLPTSTITNVVFHDGQFMLWDGRQVHRSSDGVTWSSTALNRDDMFIAGVSSSPTGTLLGFSSRFGSTYSTARFYRSTDGITWQETANSATAAGHPLKHLRYGYVDKSVCDGL